jgi:hypothetical protein
MAAADELKLPDGSAVPKLVMSAAPFLNRMSVLYGPSGSGKTVFMKMILKALKGLVDEIYLVSPTEAANCSFKGTIPPSCIHSDIYMAPPPGVKEKPIEGKIRFLETIWSRQEMRCKTAKKACDLRALAALFARCSKDARARGDEVVRAIQRRHKEALERLRLTCAAGEYEIKATAAKDVCDEALVAVYKCFIRKEYGALTEQRARLSEDELWCLKFVNFNPGIVLVFDDCAAEFKAICKTDIVRKMFYQARHYKITIIISAQDETDIDANLRKNVFSAAYMAPNVAGANFERKTNGYDKATMARARLIINAVFKTKDQRLIYIRDDPTQQCFYYFNLQFLGPQMFPSPAVVEFCEAVTADGNAVDEKNPFFAHYNPVTKKPK